MTDEQEKKLTHVVKGGQYQVVIRGPDQNMIERMVGRLPPNPPVGLVYSVIRRMQRSGQRFRVAGYLCEEKPETLIDPDGLPCDTLRRTDFVVPEDRLVGLELKRLELMIDVKDIHPGRLLAALYNASKVQGMGCLQARGDITVDEAQRLIDDAVTQLHCESDGGVYFDYLYGRVMKCHVNCATLDGRLYDRDNGQDAAYIVVKRIRQQMLQEKHKNETENIVVDF